MLALHSNNFSFARHQRYGNWFFLMDYLHRHFNVCIGMVVYYNEQFPLTVQKPEQDRGLLSYFPLSLILICDTLNSWIPASVQ